MVQINIMVDGISKPMFLQKDFYLKNKNVAIPLYAEDKNGDIRPYKTVTTNLPEKLPPNAVYVKDYGENQGVLDQLIQNNILSQPVYYVRNGYVDIPVCIIVNEELLKN